MTTNTSSQEISSATAKSLRQLHWLRITHFVLLGLVIVLYFIFTYQFKDIEDGLQNTLATTGKLLGALWTLSVFATGILEGKMVEDKEQLLFKTLQKVFSKAWLLVVFNLLLTVFAVFLMAYSVRYRAVTFTTQMPELALFVDVDDTEDDLFLGLVTKDKPLRVKLETGNYVLYFNVPQNEDEANVMDLEVLPCWKKMGALSLEL